jgi:hypothetical protein
VGAQQPPPHPQPQLPGRSNHSSFNAPLYAHSLLAATSVLEASLLVSVHLQVRSACLSVPIHGDLLARVLGRLLALAALLTAGLFGFAAAQLWLAVNGHSSLEEQPALLRYFVQALTEWTPAVAVLAFCARRSTSGAAAPPGQGRLIVLPADLLLLNGRPPAGLTPQQHMAVSPEPPRSPLEEPLLATRDEAAALASFVSPSLGSVS